jgi:hypothetical protein
MKNLILIIIVMIVILPACNQKSQQPEKVGIQTIYQIPDPQKKVIYFGSFSPFTSDLRGNMKKFENCPFDGISIKLPEEVGGGKIFMADQWEKVTEEAKQIELQNISGIAQSSILTDNFIILWAQRQMDWFSDEDWKLIADQLKFVARAAKASKCKGFLWDPEPYPHNPNPWRYDTDEKRKKFTYQEFYNQVRKRGAQFMEAIQSEFPDVVIFSLREFSDFTNGSFYSQKILPVLDQKKAASSLENAWWSLHIPFTVGIMDAINPKATIIDGNEEAYFYTSALEYYRSRDLVKNDGKALVPRELYSKFENQYQMGHAISPSYVSGEWITLTPYFPYRLKAQAKMLTPGQRALWFEHNSYYSLRTADKYVWLFIGGDWWTGKDVPEGFAEALIRAKKKVANGEHLGFSVEDMLKEAMEKAEKYQLKNKIELEYR